MIDPDAQPLPPLPDGFIWVQPRAAVPLTDRLVVCLDDIEVAMVSERIDHGYFSQVARHRVMGELAARRFEGFGPACAWVARWVELREDAIRAEVATKLATRRAYMPRA